MKKTRKQQWQRIVAGILAIALIFSNLYLPGLEQSAKAASFTGASYSFVSDNNELKITLTEAKDNDYWYEYYITVTNQSSQSICDWSIVLNCSDASKYSKAFECSASADKDAGTVTVSGSGNNKVVAAGSSVSSDTSFKLGFGSVVSFTGGTITYSYGTQSSVEDTAGGVGYSNTYLDGYACKYNLTGEVKTMDYADTPVGKHGKLHVSGTKLTDEHNEPVILRGASTHGMHWGEMTPFVNKAAFQNLRDEWGVDMVRLVSYVTQGGYTAGSQSTLDTCIQNGVSYADELGMYAIIDWHIHNEDPNTTKSQAITFFDKYSEMYADHDNIIYEICNEPTGTPWSSIKPYAEDVVETIRANDSDAIIVVGTNTWSQDVDEVATNGGKIDDANVMYTIHFYSGSHSDSLRNKVTTALNAGTPVFCTEFGICDASGNGGFDIDEANKWINYFEEKGISYCCWSLCNKDESASMISPQCSKKSGWVASDLGATGAWLINTYRDKRGDTPDATAAPTASASTTSQPSTASPEATTTATLEPGVTILAENLEANASYQPTDVSWYTNGSDTDEITLVYTCTDSEHANWGVMGWGATVDNEWTDGKSYSAGSIATLTMTETITLGELKESLGITEASSVSGLSLNVYNGGQIIKLYVKEVTVTAAPTAAPTVEPTEEPTEAPTATPIATATVVPSTTPIVLPTITPVVEPTATPVATETVKPSEAPTATPVTTATVVPSTTPIVLPTITPVVEPTATPVATETVEPSEAPTATPVTTATVVPSTTPIVLPTITPVVEPTATPIATETVEPTEAPTEEPTEAPTATPVTPATVSPSTTPIVLPTITPVIEPTATPVATETVEPTEAPTKEPTEVPTATPVATATVSPSTTPTIVPTESPVPSAPATVSPSTTPTVAPTTDPALPSTTPIVVPSTTPTAVPTLPSSTATVSPVVTPTLPASTATVSPTVEPTPPLSTATVKPSGESTTAPTNSSMPSNSPTSKPSESPAAQSTNKPITSAKPDTTESMEPAFKESQYTVYVTEELALEIINAGENSNITYSSSNIYIAEVDSNGILKAKKAGVVTITATLSNKTQITCQITVKKPKVKLKKKTLVVKRKKKVKIKFKKKLSSDSIKKCKVIGKKVVKVNKKGVVRGLKKGKATIIITMKSGAVVKCKVKVK